MVENVGLCDQDVRSAGSSTGEKRIGKFESISEGENNISNNGLLVDFKKLLKLLKSRSEENEIEDTEPVLENESKSFFTPTKSVRNKNTKKNGTNAVRNGAFSLEQNFSQIPIMESNYRNCFVILEGYSRGRFFITEVLLISICYWDFHYFPPTYNGEGKS